MVTRYAQRHMLPHEINAFLRIGVIPYDIAQTNNSIYGAALNIIKDGLQCFNVPVDVRNDGISHKATILCLILNPCKLHKLYYFIQLFAI